MTNANDPAFPVKEYTTFQEVNGLTKRELIAALAMQGYLASPNREIMISHTEAFMSTCLALADALIAELSKE